MTQAGRLEGVAGRAVMKRTTREDGGGGGGESVCTVLYMYMIWVDCTACFKINE